MEFIITIDTEADNQWDHGRELTVENLKYVPRFQELCNNYGIRPTYLVTSEVCEDAFAKKIFGDYISKDQAEVGAHLHSWTTPPFQDNVGYMYNDKYHAFATELSIDLLTEKIKTLTGQIENSFGKRPLSFRSGRFGYNEMIGKILMENNYIVDSSVTPYVSWKRNKGIQGGKGGPDFINRSPLPYRYTFTNGSLLEIPVTILPTKFPFTRSHSLARYYFRNVNENIILKALRKIFFYDQPVWFRPYLSTNINILEELINEASRIKLPYLVMMFHSSELMPGCSIYRPDKNSIEMLYTLLEQLFTLLQKREITSVSLTEAAIENKI